MDGGGLVGVWGLPGQRCTQEKERESERERAFKGFGSDLWNLTAVM